MWRCQVVVFRVSKNFPDGLASRYLVAGFDIYLAEIAVYGKEVPVSYNDRIVVTGDYENPRNDAIEHCTSFRACCGLYIYSAVVGAYIFQVLMLLLSECADYDMLACNGIGKTSFVFCKVIRQ